jgi:hypothetical protein
LLGMPVCTSALTSLTALAIEGIRPLSLMSLEVGDWLGALSGLQRLSFKRSLLDRCPPEVGALGTLRVLDLSHNELGELPTEMRGLASLEVRGRARDPCFFRKFPDVPPPSRGCILIAGAQSCHPALGACLHSLLRHPAFGTHNCGMT